jgi:hypothetical protein
VADLHEALHLPNRRNRAEPPKPSWLPRQRRGKTPQMIGRYPDYDVLASAGDWDEATRAVVFERLAMGGSELTFFASEQEPTLRAFCDVVLAQDAEPRVPVSELIDAKLAAGRLDGYRYDDMPDDRDTWRGVLDGLDATARHWHGASSFAQCAPADREGIVSAFAAGHLGGEGWEALNVARAWSVCVRMMVEAFYSHPWAWNEIGFGGPAYPLGYMRLGPLATREPRERPGATAEDPVRVQPPTTRR